MITLLSSIPELANRKHTFHVFKLCCLRLGHVVRKWPSVTLGCPGKSAAEADLSDFIEPLQSYLLSSSAEQNIFVSAESTLSCAELLDEFEDKAIQSCYDPWASVDFHDKSQIYADLTKAYENVRLASNVETGAEVTVYHLKRLINWLLNDVNRPKSLGLMWLKLQKPLLQWL